jgi:transcription elongation factor GreA
MIQGASYLSKEKYEEFIKELETLKTVKRKEIAEQLEFAKSLGDLSENAEYHEARDSQAKIEDRIMTLEALLKNVQFIKDEHKGFVDVGSTVILKNEKTGEKATWMIVGSAEADVAAGKLSNESPLGSKVIGKKVGDTLEIITPRGKTQYSVNKIT